MKSRNFILWCSISSIFSAFSLRAQDAQSTLKASQASNISAPTAIDLLHASDRSRGAALSLAGITWVADITTIENGEKSDATYNVKVYGDDALAEVIAPARQKGEKILFNDRTLWFYKPGLKKPVSISARQKLMGQAANGDIASTRYARDYEATMVGEEKVNGKDTYKLDLKAKAKNVTYDKIRYWIAKDEQVGVKAEFLTLSGEVFKIAEFKYINNIVIHDKNFPFVSEMKIQDPNNPKNETIIHYKLPKEEKHPTSIFNVNNLIQ